MKRLFFSLVIPCHNSADTVGRLLTSIAASKDSPALEVILVDDASRIPLRLQSIEGYKRTAGRQPFPLRILRLEKNVGPAVARNKGVALSRGTFIVFLDGDVELFPDALSNLATIYRDDPDIVAVTGVWVKQQRSKAFFPNFKALRDWSYWIHERDKGGYYYLFSTRIASIKKTVFLRLGGFDESYAAPLVEDIELTYRIARRYAIIFAPNVRVRHEFENFWPIAKKYFLRAYYWTRLYKRRKKFDPVATTITEAITAVSGVAVIGFGLIAIATLPSLPLIIFVRNQAASVWYQLALVNYELFLLSVIGHFVLVRRFIELAYKEKGFVFAVKSFFVGLVLYCFISAGAMWGRLRS